jgi:hypothetical protein
MTQYEQQVGAGKDIVLAIVADIGTELHNPELTSPSLAQSDRDFDYRRFSILDRKGNIVAHVNADDLADCPADQHVRAKLKTRLRQALRTFYG